MKNLRTSLQILCVFIGLTFWGASASAQKVKPSKPIDLDEALKEQAAPDRVSSYYHFSLSKWYENEGNASRALSEMRLALGFNQDSPTVHVEMAELLEKTGNIPEAIHHAEEAIRLDPQNPDPHWFLADIYFSTQERGSNPRESIQKAIQELEKVKELNPTEDRVYFSLGAAYFRLNQPDKAIESFEKFQSFSSNSDGGYREIAKYYERAGNTAKAVEYLNKGLAVQPDSVESLDLLAQIYSSQNKNKEAVLLYRKLLDATGNNVIVRRRLVESLLDAGECKEALAIEQKLIENGSSNSSDSLRLGDAYLCSRDYPEALKAYQSILAENSRDAETQIEAQFGIARTYEESGKHEDAVDELTRLLNKIPASDRRRLRIQERLSANYLKLKEFDKAIAVCLEMVKQTPAANLQLLNAYRIARRFDKALTIGKQLLEKDPSNTRMAIIYAQTLADAGKANEGAEVLSKLLQADAQNIDLYIGLSRIYIDHKRFADAETILRRAEDKSADSGTTEELKFQRAAMYEKQKDYDRAESLFKEILKANPNNAIVLNYFGYMLADRGVRLDEAVQYVKEALTIEPNNGAYLDSLGWAFFKSNDMKNAEKYLLEADGFEKNDPTIKEHLGDFYFKSGDLKKAMDYFTKSVNLGTDSGAQQEDIQKVQKKLESLRETLRKQKTEIRK
jgi:tetratricopeptide (TPR) repeat protein